MSAFVTRCMVCNATIPSIPFYLAGRARVRCLECQTAVADEAAALERARLDLKTPAKEAVRARSRAGAAARKVAAARRKMEAKP